MLGRSLRDPDGLEEGGAIRGMELLPVDTELKPEKCRAQVQGRMGQLEGILAPLSGMEIIGYEIHMGQSVAVKNVKQVAQLGSGNSGVSCGDTRGQCGILQKPDQTLGSGNADREDGAQAGNVYGSYVHGIFDGEGIASCLVRILAKQKGVDWQPGREADYRKFKESQYDLLAKGIRENMDMEYVYSILQESRI